jgi:hypothetical protein
VAPAADRGDVAAPRPRRLHTREARTGSRGAHLRARHTAPAGRRQLWHRGRGRCGPGGARGVRSVSAAAAAVYVVVSDRRTRPIQRLLLRTRRAGRSGVPRTRRLRHLRPPVGSLQHARVVCRSVAVQSPALRPCHAGERHHPRAAAQYQLHRRPRRLRRILRELCRLPRRDGVLCGPRRPRGARASDDGLGRRFGVLRFPGPLYYPSACGLRKWRHPGRPRGAVPRGASGVPHAAAAHPHVP